MAAQIRVLSDIQRRPHLIMTNIIYTLFYPKLAILLEVRLVPVIGKNFDRGPIFALISGPILPDHWTENVCFDLFLCENVRSHNRKRAFRSFSL